MKDKGKARLKAKSELARRRKLIMREARQFAGAVAMDYVAADSETPFAVTLMQLLRSRARDPEIRRAFGFPAIPTIDPPPEASPETEVPF